MLKKLPQYIDSVFQAKAERTKMEEEPVENVPDTETESDFIISAEGNAKKKHVNVFSEEVYTDNSRQSAPAEMFSSDNEKDIAPVSDRKDAGNDDFDLSDITADPSKMSKEDIIAKAEEKAFGAE